MTVVVTPRLTQARVPTLRDNQRPRGLNGAPWPHATHMRSFAPPRRTSDHHAASRRPDESHRSAHRRVARPRRVREVNGYVRRALPLRPATPNAPTPAASGRRNHEQDTGRCGAACMPPLTSAGGSSAMVWMLCERFPPRRAAEVRHGSGLGRGRCSRLGVRRTRRYDK